MLHLLEIQPFHSIEISHAKIWSTTSKLIDIALKSSFQHCFRLFLQNQLLLIHLVFLWLFGTWAESIFQLSRNIPLSVETESGPIGDSRFLLAPIPVFGFDREDWGFAPSFFSRSSDPGLTVPLGHGFLKKTTRPSNPDFLKIHSLISRF